MMSHVNIKQVINENRMLISCKRASEYSKELNAMNDVFDFDAIW